MRRRGPAPLGFTALVAAVGVERLAELAVSKRHAARSMRAGGVEYGAGHYPVMVALHSGLLAGVLAEAWLTRRRTDVRVRLPMLALVAGSQTLRWWCIATLGERWSTRVIVVPGRPLVRSGPYRLLHHPNYVAVAVEGAALPLAGSAWITATVFSGLNALLLRTRIRVENAALQAGSAADEDAAPHAAYAE